MGPSGGILRAAGVEVTGGILKEECDRINEGFFHYITTGTPYVTFKYAMTADGKIASASGKSRWISSEPAREEVHRMRHENAGIMVGIGTVLADDSMLNCRMEGGRDPVRIICDSDLRIPLDSNIVRTAKEIPTIIATAEMLPEDMESAGAEGLAKAKDLRELGCNVMYVPAVEAKTGSGTDARVNICSTERTTTDRKKKKSYTSVQMVLKKSIFALCFAEY